MDSIYEYGRDRPANPLDRVSSLWDLFSLSPDLLVLSIVVLGFDMATQVASRFVARHLVALGANMVEIGIFGALGAFLGIIVPYLGEIPKEVDDRVVLVVAGLLSPFGLFVWLTAPTLSRIGVAGIYVPPWLWMLVGSAFIYTWKIRGSSAPFAGVKSRAPHEPLVTGIDVPIHVRRFLLVAGVAPAVVLFVFVSFVPGFHVLVGLAAALGVTATVTQLALGYGGDENETGAEGRDAPEFPGLDGIVTDLRSLPARVKAVFIGDTLVQFAIGMTHLFDVLVVIQVLEIDVLAAGHDFPPSSVFAGLLAVEAVAALAATIPGEELVKEFGPRGALAFGLACAAAFPWLLVTAPASPIYLAGAFALFGFRFVADPAREALFEEIDVEESVGESYRLLRNFAIVPGPVVGGLLSAVSPVLGFGTASVVGIVGATLCLPYDRLRS